MDRHPLAATLRYADARRAAPADVARVPVWRWWRSAECWIRGHAWPKDGPVLLSHALCHCRRCGEELDGRTRPGPAAPGLSQHG
jgi:hypothetical protein